MSPTGEIKDYLKLITVDKGNPTFFLAMFGSHDQTWNWGLSQFTEPHGSSEQISKASTGSVTGRRGKNYWVIQIDKYLWLVQTALCVPKTSNCTVLSFFFPLYSLLDCKFLKEDITIILLWPSFPF